MTRPPIFVLIILLLIIKLSTSKLIEFDCRSLQSKSLTCQLPSTTHHINSRNPTIWFKNFNQARLSEMTTVEFYKYEISAYMPSRIGQTFPYITYLMFRRSSVQYVIRRNFLHMKQLKKLNLNYNLIEELPSDVFYDLPELEYLDLRENLIYELPSGLLANLKKLKYFNIESNNVEILNAEMFDNNPLIEEIYLGSNDLVTVDVDFTLMKNVRVIDLSNNVELCNFAMEIYDSEPESVKNSLKVAFQRRIIEHCSFKVMNVRY